MKKILLTVILSIFCLPLFADFCSKCGIELQNESNFCSKCGAPKAGVNVQTNEPSNNFDKVKKALMPINDFEIYCQAGNLALGVVDSQGNVPVFSQRILPDTECGSNRSLKKQ